MPRFGDASVIVIDEVDLPAPGPEEVLVEVRAAAVTPLDTYLRSGLAVGGYTPKPPYTPGSALAGLVVAAGSGVSGLALGQRVFAHAASGACAERALCPARRTYPLPGHIDFADGALVAVPYRTAYFSLIDLARAAGGETVLVHGAGGSVGAATVQLARSHGLHVIATCSAGNAERARADGAHATVDHRAADWPAAVRAAAAGRAIDIIIEVAAKANLSTDLDLAAARGRIVIVGGQGATSIDPLPVISKGLSLFGVSLPNIPPQRDQQIMAAIVAGLENGTLRPRVSSTFPLHDIIAAHQAVESGRGSGGVALLMADAGHQTSPVFR